MPNLDLTEFGAPAPSLDLTEFQKPPKAVGALSYIGSQAKAGLTADLPTIAGKALQYAGATDLGGKLRSYGEENAAQVQPDEGRGAVTKMVAGALRGAAPIVPLAVGGLLAQGTPAGPALDVAGAAALAGGFGGSQAQDTLEKAKAAGLSDEAATSVARKTGLITGVGMGAVGALTGGIAAPAIRAIAGTGAKTAAETLAEAAAPSIARPFVADTAGHLAGNVASMAAANAGTAAVEKQAGLPGPTPGQAALEGLESGTSLTAALLPFGLARTALARRANTAAVERLQSADTDPQQRAEVAAQIHANLHAVDPEAAAHFANNVAQAIDAKQPLQLGQDLLGPQEAPPQPAAPLALPAPVARVDAQGNARMDGVQPPVQDEPAAQVAGRAPIDDTAPQQPAVPALPAPTVVVDAQGNALTAADRNAQRQAGVRETGAMGLGRNSDVTDVEAKPSRAQQMGIDPNAGPISRAAAIAVDGGAHDTAMAQAAAAEAEKAPKGKPDEATPEPAAKAAPVEQAAAAAGEVGREPARGEAAAQAGDEHAGEPPAAVKGVPDERTGSGKGPSVPAGSDSRVEPTADRDQPTALPAEAPRPRGDTAAAGAPAPEAVKPAEGATNKVPVGQPFRTRLAAAPALRRAGPGHEVVALAEGGFAVRKVEKAAGESEEKPLSIGMTPNSTEPVTVKDGVVHIGKNPAVNFDSGEPVKVKAGASHEDIKQALREASALSRRQRFFGGEEAAADKPVKAARAEVAAPVRYGKDGVELTKGGEPFASKKEADAHRKEFIKQGRVIQVEGGFAVRDPSDTEMKARQQAGNRLQADARKKAWESNPMLAFLAEHGLYHEEGKKNSQKAEFSPDKNINVRGYGNVFRADGMHPDKLAELAAEEGFLPPGSRDADHLSELIRRAVAGQRVIPQFAEGEVEKEHAAQLARHEELSDLVPDDLEAEGYSRAPTELQAYVRELIAKAEAAGHDHERILEELARKNENASDDDYLVAARDAFEKALSRTGEVGAQDRGGPARAQGTEPARSQEGHAEGLTPAKPADRFTPPYTALKGKSVTIEVPLQGGKTARVTHDAQKVLAEMDRRAEALREVQERCK